MPTIHHTLTIGGVEIECEIDHTPEAPDTRWEPGNEEEFELIDARIGPLDATELVAEHLWDTLLANLLRERQERLQDVAEARAEARSSWFAHLGD